MKGHVEMLRETIRRQRGYADAEIDDFPGLEFARATARNDFLGTDRTHGELLELRAS
jgi:hypothetical protein